MYVPVTAKGVILVGHGRV